MRSLWPVLLLVACTGEEEPAPDPEVPTTETDTAGGVDTAPSEPTSTSDTGPTSDTGTTDTGTTEPCPLPPAPTSWDYISDVPTSEDFTFDELGNLVNIDDGIDALIRTPYQGTPEVLAPYSSPELAGITFLLDGDLALADEGQGALVRLGLDGTQEVMVGSMNQPNSVTIDDKGFVYVTAFDAIRRVDPATGDATTLAVIPGADLDGLTFSSDFLTLYYNYDEDSVVGKLELDAYGNVLSQEWIANLPQPGGGELDGMTIDECDNVYAIATDGSLFRVLADGTPELLMTLTAGIGLTTTSIHFGSGIGGWEDDHLYVMDRNGGLFDIDLGIKGRKEPWLP